MKILAIETSCDETCVSVVEASGKKRPHFEILSNIVSSQVKIHRKWGGVYPALAKREHQKNLTPILVRVLSDVRMLKKTQISKLKSQNYNLKLKTLKEILIKGEYLFNQLGVFLFKYKRPEIDLMAVTVGPGLEPCLWVGVNFAKALAYFWNLPIVPINHIEAHIYANWLSPIGTKSEIRNPKSETNIFPAICLVVSGGHTQLIFMKDFGNYKILGETRDDAAGECFDKVAKILGLGYPGGPEIEKQTTKTDRDRISINLPRPMIYQKNYDFSFAGLKTAVLYNFRSQPQKIRKSKKYIREVCKEAQQAMIDVLIHKTIRAAKEFKAKSIILGGGVVANEELRKQFKTACLKSNFRYLAPPKIFCLDNAAMVGVVAYHHWLKSKRKTWKDIEANANLRLS